MLEGLEKYLAIFSCCLLIPLLTFAIVADVCEHEDITIITQEDEVLTFHVTHARYKYSNEGNTFSILNEKYCNIKYIKIEYHSWCSCK